MRKFASLAVAGLAAASCVALAIAAPEAGRPTFGAWGVDLTSLDTTVKPGDNFSQYVNGKWSKTAVIPADRSNTGSFQDLQILSENRMKEIIAGLEAKPYATLSVDEKKLRDLYDAFEDQNQIERNGLNPVRKDLAYIAHLKSLTDVARAMASVPLSTESIFGIGIGVDDKNPNAYSVNLAQSGIGLPDRDYYLRDDAALEATRIAYKKYLSAMLALAGLSDPDKRAAAIFDVEARIAKAQWNRADRRDTDKTYNPMPYSELKRLAPEFPWDAFFKEAHIPKTAPNGERTVIIAEKSAFPDLAKIFATTPVAVWRDYLTVHYLHVFSAYLPKRFDDTDFAFYGTVLGGRTQQLDRPTRGVHLLDGALGEVLGRLYVAKYFPPEAKAKADALVSNLLKAYEVDIQTLSWMSDATKTKALQKIHQFTPKIGYPSHWLDYSAYRIARNDLIGDIQRGNVFESNREVRRLDKPVDKTEWGMTPPTINAYYNPSFNEVVFPAAILQPPFFDPNADDAVNYGGIGAVIGHEISHGFDDQGSKYTGEGVFSDWWTKEDRTNFDSRTTMIVKQFDSYEPLPGLHVIGANTLGENIADLAGLTIALKAYHLSLGGKPAPVMDGYTGDQRFFLAFGQIWRQKQRESALRTQTLSNEHSPAEFRVIGTTRNIDAWYDAFDVKPGDKYYLAPEQRIRLW
ncbi:MAG TPA: M13 family metallopeptidase [Rhizomicrobium sp.]